MRVTNNMMTMNLLYNVNSNLERMSDMQDQLATGKRISSPSDDPVLASKVLARKTDLSELVQYEKNTRDAIGWMEITEKSIEDNGEIMQRIRELTVQAANGVNTADDTQKIAAEIENMKEQLVANGNATFAGRYIFSGFETDKKLLNEDGSFNIDIDDYSINNTPVVQYEVSVGESMDVMTSGLDIYGYVPETNIMTDHFPAGDAVNGVAATKERRVTTGFDFTQNFTLAPGSLDVTIGGTNYVVDVTNLNGSVNPVEKEVLLERINDALNPTPPNAIGKAFFDASDNLVIESQSYGDPAPSADISVGAGYGVTTLTAGVDEVNASLTGTAIGTPPGTLTAVEQDLLMDNNVNIVINGVSKKIKPDPTFTITDVNSYVTHMQSKIDTAFGAGQATIIQAGGAITITALASADGSTPNLAVDFPRTHKSQLIEDMDELLGYLNTGDSSGLSSMLTKVDGHMNNMLSLRADIGARNNRLDMISKKIASSNVSFTKMLSDAEDADMSEVIMHLKNAENVYNASLSVGAKVIQPSLVDFLR